MLIQSVKYGDNRRPDIGAIKIAESTTGNYGDDGGGIIYFTNNNRNIQHLSFWEKSWIIGRLK